MEKSQNKKQKWYVTLLIAVLVIIFLPLILCFSLCAIIWALIEHLKKPLYRKKYEQSAYFRDLQIPYQTGILYDICYLFYNEAKIKGIPFTFVLGEKNYGYLLRNNEVYLFSDFAYLQYNDAVEEWQVNFDGDMDFYGDKSLLSEELARCVSLLKDEHKNLPIHIMVTDEKLLVRRNLDDSEETEHPDRADNLLPPYITVCKNYLSAYAGYMIDGDI